MDIFSADFVKSSAFVEKCPDSSLPEYAFIGRSNVGKSSLINMLTGRNNLAMTSSKPGKTLLINHFIINNQWHLVDLPGYGFANVPDKVRSQLKPMIYNYVLKRMQMTNLFLLIDCRLSPQKVDLEFIDFLGTHEVPFSIIFTKTDKISASALNINVAAYKEKLKEQWSELPPIFLTSANKSRGRDEVLNYIEQINNSLSASEK